MTDVRKECRLGLVFLLLRVQVLVDSPDAFLPFFHFLEDNLHQGKNQENKKAPAKEDGWDHVVGRSHVTNRQVAQEEQDQQRQGNVERAAALVPVVRPEDNPFQQNVTDDVEKHQGASGINENQGQIFHTTTLTELKYNEFKKIWAGRFF